MKKQKILIVEDEAIVALNLSNLVRRLDYDVIKVVDTGDAAIKVALEHDLDLILMDIRLKGEMDGTQAAKIIRQSTDVAIIFLTAYSDDTTIKNAMGAQSFGYLIKPFDERQLNIAIQLELHKRIVDRKLRIQSVHLQQIVSSIPEGLVLIDKDRNIQHVNSYALGYLEIIKGIVSSFKDMEDCFKGAFFDELSEATVDGAWYEVISTQPNYQVFELQVRTLNNHTITELIEDLDGWVLIIRDQTRQKLANQRISQQEKFATIGQLAAGIAHDFNNILASIMIRTDLMLMQSNNLPAYHKLQLEKNKQSIDSAKNLIGQVLDFGRRSSPATEEIQLSALLDESIDLFGPMLPATVQLELDILSDSCLVDVNKTLMLQVLMNLVLNARDAMSEAGGQLKITLQRTRIPTEPGPLGLNEWACVTIEDTGIGMAEDVAQHIFEPFYTTKFAHGGTGLGLAQVYGIVEQHKGFIDFSSKINDGTKFIIYLPLVNHDASRTVTTALDDVQHMATKRILMVEDDISARETLCEALQMSGYDVVPAADGQEALNILAADHQFDIVLSDINMPHINGFELYNEICNRKYDLTFSYMSGFISEDATQRIAKANVNVLKKPFSVDELLAYLDMGKSDQRNRKSV